MRTTAFLLALLLLTLPTRSAEPRELWLYYPVNIAVDKNIDKLQDLWSRAAKAGYTHILLTDSKFARLGKMDAHYFKNADRIKKIAADLKLTLVPAMFSIGYSNDLLANDPNLAEGLPVRDALFVVKDNLAIHQPDPAISFKPKWDSKDDAKVDGNTATITDNPGNSRLVQKLKLTPFRHYHVSVQIKTTDYKGKPEIKALAASSAKGELPSQDSLLIPNSLNWTNIHVKPTQDWTTYHITFNSLGHSDVNLYLGVWGKATGTLQWRDWKIEEVGLLNVLRREGTPLVIKDETGKTLVEGKDFDPIKDPKMGTVPYAGEYEIFHESPSFKTHNLPDGARLRVSWYHPHKIYDDQICCCPSDPALKPILVDQAARMKKLWGDVAGGWMMSHDEIRVMNTDAACLATGKTPGQILADNARFCISLLKDTNKPIYVWNDMFDPNHNAVPGPYYLVNGPFTNSWEGLDPSIRIMNWHFGKRDQNLPFFADKGHQQVIAGYYDAKPEKVTDWLTSADKVKNVTGVMYTTWRQDYTQIEKFAELVKAHKQ